MSPSCNITLFSAGKPCPIICAVCGLGPCRMSPSYSMQAPQPNDKEIALEAVRILLKYIGEDPDRPGLRDTPERVLKAWRNEWGSGYSLPKENLVKLFKEEGKFYDEMVIVRGITFQSTCEHHMAPFFGTADVSYIPDPNKGIIGLSKLARIVNHFSRRLQVQERLTNEIADFLVQNVSSDAAIVMKATHLCMVSRGVQQPNAITVTSAMRGAYYNVPTARQEFLKLCNAV